MPALCTGVVKDLVYHTVSDVIVDGVGADFACLPSERSKLFAVPSGISLCSSEFIQGVLLGAGTCDASFIIHSLRVPILVTSAAPYRYNQNCDEGTTDFALGVNPNDFSTVMLIAQLLVTQMQISFLVQDRVQICEFASQFPAGGGVDAEISAVGCTTTNTVPDECAPCPFVGVFNNGTPSFDNRFNLIQPIGISNGMSIGATVAFDNVATSNGACISVLDLLASTGTTCTPSCSTGGICPDDLLAASGIVVKADFAVDGLLCRAVC